MRKRVKPYRLITSFDNGETWYYEISLGIATRFDPKGDNWISKRISKARFEEMKKSGQVVGYMRACYPNNIQKEPIQYISESIKLQKIIEERNSKL